MHLQTLAITINQSLIGHNRYYEVGFGAGTPQQDSVCAARRRGLAPTSSCGDTTRNGKQAKAGYHHGGGTLPFALHPLYCTFRVNRCVRPYMAGTHVRRKKGRFLHIGVFFRLSVWYTRFSLTNLNLQDGETYGRIDTKMFMGNYRLI